MSNFKFSVHALALVLGTGLATGATWSPAGPPGGTVSSLSVCQSNPSIVYSSVPGAGLIKSTDGGATWSPSSTGISNLNVLAVGTDPTDPNTAYAGSYLYGHPAGGISKTTDGGASWATANSGITNKLITVVKVNPGSPTEIYVGTAFGGVFHSSDGGASWQNVSSGDVANATVAAIAVDPSSNVYASIAVGGNGAGALMKSANHGSTWSHADAGLPSSDIVGPIAFVPGSPATVLVGTLASGIFKSSNGGGSWNLSSAGVASGAAVTSLAFDPSSPSSVYAGGDGGAIYQSTDGGAHWTKRRSGAAGSVIGTLSVTPAASTASQVRALGELLPLPPPTVLADATDVGVLRSTDGASFGSVSSGHSTLTIYWLAVDPSSDKRAYAAGYAGGFFKTTDGGTTWSQIDSNLPEKVAVSQFGYVGIEVTAIAVDPTSPTTLYAGLGAIGPGYAPTGGGVFKSTDSGATWKSANTGITDGTVQAFVGGIAVDPSQSANLYTAVTSLGIFKSINGGTSWAPATTGIEAHAYCNDVSLNPYAPTNVFAMTSSGLYRSTDSGGHWALSDAGLDNSPATQALAFDPTNSQRVFAGNSYGGFFTSTNGGANWIAASNGLATTALTGITYAPGSSTLYAATTDAGVFQSLDRGAHWTPLNDGLPTTTAFSIAAGAGNSSAVYVGLYGAGVAKTGAAMKSGRVDAVGTSGSTVARIGGR